MREKVSQRPVLSAERRQAAREHWERVRRVAAEVDEWPEWKRRVALPPAGDDDAL